MYMYIYYLNPAPPPKVQQTTTGGRCKLPPKIRTTFSFILYTNRWVYTITLGHSQAWTRFHENAALTPFTLNPLPTATPQTLPCVLAGINTSLQPLTYQRLMEETYKIWTQPNLLFYPETLENSCSPRHQCQSNPSTDLTL